MSRIVIAVLVVLAACGTKKEPPKGDEHGSGAVASGATPADAAAAPPDGKLDPKQAAAAYDKACVANDYEACRNLGVLYNEGIGVPQDPKRATALFAMACNGGNLAACNHTALALAEGIGVAKDVPKAVELYTKACDGNYALACRNLGLMLRDGRGVDKDLARAEALLDKACSNKAPFACTNAGELQRTLALTKGATDKDARFKKMIDDFKQGCDGGDPIACRSIGIAYIEGTGLPKATNAAAVWLTRACDKDEPIACRVLGAMLIDGVGVHADPTKGRELLQRACDRKDADACSILKRIAEPSPNRDAGAPSTGAGVDAKAPM